MGRKDDSLCPGENYLRTLVNDSSDELRKLMERWENTVPLENISSLAKEYIDGRLSVACDVEIRSSLDNVDGPHMVDDGSMVMNAIVGIVGSANSCQRKNRKRGNQEAVCTSDVDGVKAIEGVIPSSVWLYSINNKLDEVRSNADNWTLSFALFNLSYHFLPFSPKGESEVIIGRSSSPYNEFIRQLIKRRPQIVNRIPNKKCDGMRDRGGHLKLEDIATNLIIFLAGQSIKIRAKKSKQTCLQLLDVLVGPCDLEP